MISLSTSVEEIPKIGAIYAKKLKKFGIKTVQDLLFYFPARYDDFSEIISIKQARQRLGETVCVQGQIAEIENSNTFKKWNTLTQALVQDDNSEIKAIWFNQPYLAKSLRENDFVCLAGKVALYKEGIYLNNPSYERINEIGENEELTHTGRIVPVYSETRGVTSRWLRYVIKPLLYRFVEQIQESLPEEIIKKYKFLPIQEAVWQLHFPESFEHADAAKNRFSFEELFLIQLNVLKEKIKLMLKKAPACPMNTDLMKQFTDSLPFLLTDSQKKCAFAILKDLEKPVPMSRLLEGDVGSGKTVVGAMAALSVVKGNADSSELKQVAFMAPTEILAKQHFKTVSELLKNFDVKIGMLTSKDARIFNPSSSSGHSAFEVSKKSFNGDLENGQIDIAIGTHSLIQKNVVFKNLALVILDEQHRFGVEQRDHLIKNKKIVPHLLSMTATPIPRTLALTVYGDLDLSLIDEMPKNRKKVKTIIVEPSQRKEAYEFIKKEVSGGKGVFVIYPKIDSAATKAVSEATKGSQTSTNLWKSDFHTIPSSFSAQNYNVPSLSQLAINEVKALKEEYEKLSKEIFPDLRITMLHGKMKAPEKERIMLDFKKGEIDILLSTSVVEVGVDVPRATIMMIEGAERFGLSQLHQFRGRVGRSDMQSYCFLFTTDPSMLNRKRLKALVESSNGFELAEKDLEIRGPGSLYGTQQSGIPDMAMQGLSNIFLVEKTRAAAKEILEKDSELKNYPQLKERLKLFQTKIHFE
ncbi:MAG: ATP-dependent DNA helicase RecG [Candidatus Staskawiczbacteria bacterium RIFOXYB1_FULL_37_44]|uniref:Probable DNA 3'-5' helicase RecG n=1 Tax=Candidatus Staskawiczbacteria bacterium RIFOXYB1_FULL_37_44 TaxID=1802223 RepID=A0A1G2IVF3_9BACT|nr:MAG: ATP-dependent DNA helicase RecG [Candidatus Staskawiczbacteria bacterium RIFOXYB1_FULL_37_44]OGZ82789.1 MAG: ATP-dependent DNA helicase RecG [Candidatus Staskawiczbacteria bacterium RIFOXYC1_FULL_37_52]OGZ87309.1 MAG: ATP-dependent DNA helicase RecG [Candidatus Staskawiczbacteria bacterium RIFOXYC2_FULL_37_19]OGZ90560.1 MAG: ATP-dependent DNA helicase RecG [Candidatus Staskawiczbacteria bacterium RIFOXYD1_FULL_37_110]